MERRYTVAEIDDLRRMCDLRFLFGTTYPSNETRWSHSYQAGERERAVEEMVRTYLLAGITADDIRAADMPTSASATKTDIPPPSPHQTES